MTQDFQNKLISKLQNVLKREPTEKEKGNVVTDYIIVQQVLLEEQEALKVKVDDMEIKLKDKKVL